MKRGIEEKLVAIGILGFLAAVLMLPAPGARAFDPENVSPVGYAPNFCLVGNSWTTQKLNQFQNGIDAWNDAAPGLGIQLQGIYPFASYDFAGTWVQTLDGSFAVTSASNISFAHKDENGVSFNWNFTNDECASVPDFRAVVTHEVGHSFGLKHPEFNDTYEWKSWDGEPPTMAASQKTENCAPGRTLQQDDVAGAFWMKSRQWVAKPEMGAQSLAYWNTGGGGSLNSCDPSYACLTNGPSNTSYTIRFTVDAKSSRSTPAIAVTWTRNSGTSGTLKLELQTRNIPSKASGLGPGSWDVLDGPTCSTPALTWQTCTWNPSFPATNVRDVKLVIRNQTDGTIRLQRVEAVDG